MRNLLGTVAIVVTGLGLMAAPAAGAVAQEERLSASVQPAIVYIESTFSGYVFDTKLYEGEPWGYLREAPFTVTLRCSGFGVNPDGYIVTAGHCVEFTDEIRAAIIVQAARFDRRENWPANAKLSEVLRYAQDHYRIDGAERRGRPDLNVETAFGIAVSGISTGDWRPARVLGMQGFAKGDVALLKVEAEDVPSLVLAPEAEIGVGTDVVSVGFAASVDLVTDPTFAPSFMDGTISAERTIGGNLLEVFEVSANVSGGMSGGPTVDPQGRVIGLNSFGIRGEAQPNYIRPASIIDEMLRDEGVTNEPGEVQRLYLAGLDSYFEGDRARALENFDRVLDLVPSHELAQEFRAKAVRLPDARPTEGSDGGNDLDVIVGGVGLLALASGATVLIVRRRRERSNPPAASTVILDDLPPAPLATPNTERLCAQCGTPQLLGARFCSSCGAAVEEHTHA
jgi:S1-C subfamily serine protease